MKLKQIADHIGGEISGDPEKEITGIAPFEAAAENDITFAATPQFIAKLDKCNAGAVLVSGKSATTGYPNQNLVRVSNPQVSFTRVISLFHPEKNYAEGIHHTAVTGEEPMFGKGASIGAYVVIGNNVRIGKNTVIRSHCCIGDNVTIGDNCLIHPGVYIGDRAVLGNEVIIHPRAVIGGDGYGFARDGAIHVKIPHIGIVRIGDRVEIGSGTAIDRAVFGETVIDDGVKIDNLVHIGHNVTIGANSLLIAQVGIAGSCKVGANVIMAGQAGMAQHLSIGDNAIAGPQAGIAKDIMPGEIVSGSPALPHRLWLKTSLLIKKLPDLAKKLSLLEKRMNRLEGVEECSED